MVSPCMHAGGRGVIDRLFSYKLSNLACCASTVSGAWRYVCAPIAKRVVSSARVHRQSSLAVFRRALLSILHCVPVHVGDLVVIRDSIKNAEVIEFMQSFSDSFSLRYDSCDGAYPWLGAQDCDAEGCNWVDGSPWVRHQSDLMLFGFAERVCSDCLTSDPANGPRSLNLPNSASTTHIFIFMWMEDGVPGLALRHP